MDATSRTGLRLPLPVLATVGSVFLVSPTTKGEKAVTDRAEPSVADRFDGDRAYEYLTRVCSIGPRVSGTEGMQAQQRLLLGHFQQLGAEARLERFRYPRHPLTKRPVELANLFVEWRPEARQRILFCAHYDTRPLPDRDPDPWQRKNGVFLGANDGGSGVAVLMEMGHHVAALPEGLGLDFVLFDAEELVYTERDQYFLGSLRFAQQYKQNPPPYRYVAGVLLDMVGDKQLSVYQEANSTRTRATRALVKEVWGTAKELGVDEFIPTVLYEVKDDHLPLNAAGIPTINVIDFVYPSRWKSYWHTTQDAPANCSGESLGKVGRVMLRWLEKKLPSGNEAAIRKEK